MAKKAYGATSYHPTQGLKWTCPHCGHKRTVRPGTLADEFRWHHGTPLARHSSWSLSLRDCPGCHIDYHFNCNLPDDHPDPTAKVINQMITTLLRTHSNGLHPPHDQSHPSAKVMRESQQNAAKYGMEAVKKALEAKK